MSDNPEQKMVHPEVKDRVPGSKCGLKRLSGAFLRRVQKGVSRQIYHNILLGLEIQHTLTAAAKTHARELLKTYGLEKFADSRPSELSGGMRQRTALIRTLILEPDLLLLDEPFSALDYQTRLSVGDDIGQIIRDSGRTAVLVTHDLSEAISLADTIFILSKRPASIARIVPVTFTLASDTPLKRRNAPEFRHTSIFYGRS